VTIAGTGVLVGVGSVGATVGGVVRVGSAGDTVGSVVGSEVSVAGETLDRGVAVGHAAVLIGVDRAWSVDGDGVVSSGDGSPC